MSDNLKVDVWLDARTYRAFAWFDTVVRTGNWRRPAVFAGFFSALAVLSFVVAPRTGGVLLGIVLLLVGLGLPLSYFTGVHRSISRRLTRLKLKGDTKRFAYTLSLDEVPGKLLVTTSKGETLQFDYAGMAGAWRRQRAIYLHVAPQRAYIIPTGAANALQEVYWAFISQAIPPEHVHG